MRLFSNLSFVFLLLALVLQFLVVHDPNKGMIHDMGARAEARAEQLGGQTAASQETIAQHRRGLWREQRQSARDKVENLVGRKASCPQLALGAMALGLVCWAGAYLRKEDQPPVFRNVVPLAAFCLIRWLNFL